jgi:hypothetical protein
MGVPRIGRLTGPAPAKPRTPRRRRRLRPCALCGVLLDHFIVTFSIHSAKESWPACLACTETAIGELHGARESAAAWLEAWWRRGKR